MGKRSAADKAETHAQLLRHASRAFRVHGSSVGIGDLMKELGLTHGGFYRHFDSKDELFIEALALSFQEIGEKLEKIAEKAGKGQELRAIITAYLSSDHLLHPETWCALAALAPDISRHQTGIRKRLDSAMMLYMERMSKYMPGETAQERRKTFLVLFSGMAGVIAMVRAFGDSKMREQALGMALDYYLKTFPQTAAAASSTV